MMSSSVASGLMNSGFAQRAGEQVGHHKAGIRRRTWL
jgi:hypothetical protein